MSSPVAPSDVKFIQAQGFVLSGSGASIGDVTITLQSFYGIDGNTIVTADLGTFAYGTLEPGNGTQEEAILFTGVTQNANGTATLTGVSSLGFKTPYDLTTGLTKTHAGNSTFILSNDAAFYNNLVLYMNDIAGAGAANASTTVKGIVQAATSAQINAGTPTGSTAAVLVVTPDALAASSYGTTYLTPTGAIMAYTATAAPTSWLMCDGAAVSRTGSNANLFTLIGETFGAGDGVTTFNVPNLVARVPMGAGAAPTKVATFASRSSNVITVTGLSNAANNEFQTGQAVVYTSSGSVITGLTSGVTYYVVRTGNLTFSLATSMANAVAGSVISLSSDGSGTQLFTLTLTARTLASTGGEENHALITDELSAHTHGPGGSYTAFAGALGGSGEGFSSSFSGEAAGMTATAANGSSTAHNNIQPFLVLSYIIKT